MSLISVLSQPANTCEYVALSNWEQPSDQSPSTAYDVENWHGMERYEFDAKGETEKYTYVMSTCVNSFSVSIQDLAEYHAPSFQACAREANVSAFMCTYSKHGWTKSMQQVLIMQRRCCQWDTDLCRCSPPRHHFTQTLEVGSGGAVDHL